MTRLIVIAVALLCIAFVPWSFQSEGLTVGSKKFTESVILGEVVRGLALDAKVDMMHARELGGTKILFDSLVNGEIDIYPEYTGTIAEEILGGLENPTQSSLRKRLGERGITMSRPLGFNNTYALAMTKARAAELGVTCISDLVRHPDLIMGFGNEFANRNDGWKNLRPFYGLPQTNVQGLDHDLAYRQLQLGAIDVLDVYSTDAKINVYDLQVLKDDRNYFPRYDSVLLFRENLSKSQPIVKRALERLEGAIDERAILDANTNVEVEGISESQAAAQLLKTRLNVQMSVQEQTRLGRIVQRTIEHLDLVRRSLIPAILVGIPLGIVAHRYQWFGQIVLSTVSVIQTIPSLALLVMLMPLMAYFGLASIGLGSATAVTALFLYSLLPIVRNTVSGLSSVSAEHHETGSRIGFANANSIDANRIAISVA